MDIKVGISSCVNGESVRFDGGHKSNKFASKVLAPYFTYVPICPEVGSGMSVPRPTIRLITNEQRIALVDSKDSSLDYTDSMIGPLFVFFGRKWRQAATLQPRDHPMALFLLF